MEQSTVHNLLTAVAGTPPPPTTVDIRRAAAQGRRRVRLRWIGASSSSAVVVAAGAVVASLVLGAGSSALRYQLGTTNQPNPAASLAMPATAPTAFNPMVQYAEPGWMPDGAVGQGMSVGREHLVVSADYQGPPNKPGNDHAPATVSLTVVTAGR